MVLRIQCARWGRDSIFQWFGVLASLVVGPLRLCCGSLYIYILRAGGGGYDLPFLVLTLTVFSGGFKTLWLLLRLGTCTRRGLRRRGWRRRLTLFRCWMGLWWCFALGSCELLRNLYYNPRSEERLTGTITSTTLNYPQVVRRTQCTSLLLLGNLYQRPLGGEDTRSYCMVRLAL